jgi:ATP synthase protein I
MPNPDEPSQGALKSLDKRLDAFEAGRRARPSATGMGAAGDGYRLLGQMLGGVFGGIGLGWLIDHFAHTSPWGVVGGLLIGAAAAIYSTVRTATQMSARAAQIPGPPATAAPDDEEDEDQT